MKHVIITLALIALSGCYMPSDYNHKKGDIKRWAVAQCAEIDAKVVNVSVNPFVKNLFSIECEQSTGNVFTLDRKMSNGKAK